MPRLLAYAAIALISYIVALHPLSGMIGGLVFLVVGWVLPTMINLLLAAWCTKFIRAAPWLRFAGFVLISFLLGINTAFPSLIARAHYKPDVTTEIHRAATVTAKTKVDLWLRSLFAVAVDPLSSPLSVEANEQCGCMRFVPNPAASYFLKVNEIINERAGLRPGVIKATNYTFVPSALANGVHFDINFSSDPETAGTVELLVDVYDGAEKTASFRQRGIPYDPGIEQRTGQQRTLLNGHFLENCSTMLLRDNVWTYLLRNQASYLRRAALQDFLAQAVRRQ